MLKNVLNIDNTCEPQISSISLYLYPFLRIFLTNFNRFAIISAVFKIATTKKLQKKIITKKKNLVKFLKCSKKFQNVQKCFAEMFKNVFF